MATKQGEMYKCAICGNEVVVTDTGGGTLVCCGQPMAATGEGYTCSK